MPLALTPKVLRQIRVVVQELPTPTLEAVIDALSSEESVPMDSGVYERLMSLLPKPSWRQSLKTLLNYWNSEVPSLSGQAITIALATAADCRTTFQKEMSVELVWTGPNPEALPLRRTDQALLQIIQDAEHELTIVSFAVYKIPEIIQALLKALKRGVKLRLIIESLEASNGKIAFDALSSFGTELTKQAQILAWPLEKRTKTQEGKYGSLHAKCAICDEKYLFISSANLTEYALALNMEIGVLIQNQQLTQQMLHHINCLIYQGYLVDC